MRYTTLILLPLLALVAGCSRGPARGELEELLAQRLDQEFESGLFEVASFKRRGSYPYTIEGDDGDRMLVYYDARLGFQRDRQLTDWDSLGVGSLIQVLGANPRGVSGVSAEGNQSGDELLVRGSIVFARGDGDWQPVDAETLPMKSGTAATDSGGDHAESPDATLARLDRLKAIDGTLQSQADSTGRDELHRQLDSVTEQMDRRLARKEGALILATGVAGGDYAALGQGLARLIGESGGAVHLVPSGGSLDNCALVEAGEADVAFAQNDIAQMARRGTGLFEGRLPMSNLQTLCSLYPEAVQLLVRRGGAVQQLEDLRGRAVDVGPGGSGIRINATQVLAAGGMTLADLGRTQGNPAAVAVDDLLAGRVEAVFLTGAYPFAAVSAASQTGELQVIALPAMVIGQLCADNPAYVSLTLPARTYPGQAGDVATVGVTATLVAHRGVSDTQVTALLEALYANVDQLGQDSLRGYQINRGRGLDGIAIPAHPAARRFLEP